MFVIAIVFVVVIVVIDGINYYCLLRFGAMGCRAPTGQAASFWARSSCGARPPLWEGPGGGKSAHNEREGSNTLRGRLRGSPNKTRRPINRQNTKRTITQQDKKNIQ